eukprot:m.35544 g.35544  ORF g.35544 m.35544 type:complete len:320 (-) comp12401_c0_seq3:141-1100(-)
MGQLAYGVSTALGWVVAAECLWLPRDDATASWILVTMAAPLQLLLTTNGSQWLFSPASTLVLLLFDMMCESSLNVLFPNCASPTTCYQVTGGLKVLNCKGQVSSLSESKTASVTVSMRPNENIVPVSLSLLRWRGAFKLASAATTQPSMSHRCSSHCTASMHSHGNRVYSSERLTLRRKNISSGSYSQGASAFKAGSGKLHRPRRVHSSARLQRLPHPCRDELWQKRASDLFADDFNYPSSTIQAASRAPVQLVGSRIDGVLAVESNSAGQGDGIDVWQKGTFISAFHALSSSTSGSKGKPVRRIDGCLFLCCRLERCD